jgi:predicted nucleic acid-binding protein
MVKILEAPAIMLYLEKKPGYEKVRDLLTRAAANGNNLLVSTVNMGELYYLLLRHRSTQESDKIMALVETFPIDFISVDSTLAKQAALFRLKGKLSYEQCIAAALAKVKRGELITAETEFKVLEGEIRIVWI